MIMEAIFKGIIYKISNKMILLVAVLCCTSVLDVYGEKHDVMNTYQNNDNDIHGYLIKTLKKSVQREKRNVIMYILDSHESNNSNNPNYINNNAEYKSYDTNSDGNKLNYARNKLNYARNKLHYARNKLHYARNKLNYARNMNYERNNMNQERNNMNRERNNMNYERNNMNYERINHYYNRNKIRNYRNAVPETSTVQQGTIVGGTLAKCPKGKIRIDWMTCAYPDDYYIDM